MILFIQCRLTSKINKAKLRNCNDKEGDTCIALILFLNTADNANFAVNALKAEGLGDSVSILFHPDIVDLHVYYHWHGILAQRSWSEFGGS